MLLKITKRKLLTLTPIAGVFFLTACATPYTCEMGMECLDVHDAYEASRANGGTKESVITNEQRLIAENTPLSKSRGSTIRAGAVQGDTTKEGVFQPYAGVKLQDKPVYIPPQPLRIWIAPWVDSETYDGQKRLLSGQFMYVTIGGKWTMGEMTRPGTAGNVMFEPWSPKPKDDKRVGPAQLLRD